MKNTIKTFWDYNGIKPDRRYYVLFSTWNDNVLSRSVTGYDSLEDATEECKLINVMYADTPIPQKVHKKDGKYYNSSKNYHNTVRWDYDYSNGAYFWGYALLDLKDGKILKSVNDYRYGSYVIKKKNELYILDFYLRMPGEVPAEYDWDDGEYEGWLQYRWGDGKNAVGYESPEDEMKAERKLQDVKKLRMKVWDSINECYVHKTHSYVIVERDKELPKRLPHVSYYYPDMEPVMWPGGYDDVCLGQYEWLNEEFKAQFLKDAEKYNKKATQLLGDFFK